MIFRKELPNGDTLLLDSNIEISNESIAKMQKHAYMKENIATVSPLHCKHNFYDCKEVIKKSSYDDCLEIGEGTLDCLYIKKEAMNVIDSFDNTLFDKCLAHGYRHILCGSAAAFEKETFSDTEPVAFRNIFMQKNANYNLCVNNSKSNILIFTNCWDLQYEELLGGTSLHVLDLINLLRTKYNFHVLAPFNGYYRLSSYWETGEESLEIFTAASNPDSTNLYSSEYYNMLKEIIISFNIDIIHIHHLMGHYFDILDVLKGISTQLFITLHDFYSVCPRINKINTADKYCGTSDVNKCSVCLPLPSTIITWRNTWHSLLSSAKKIITPSKSALSEIKETFTDLSIEVIEHGVDKNEIITTKPTMDKIDFNIAFTGKITTIKGKTIIENLINYSEHFDDNIKFHFFGNMNSNIITEKNNKVIFHGEYLRKDIGKLLTENDINLVCIFSIWPETYSYTLSESVMNNIPVLAMDIGALGQRIKDNQLGWLIKYENDISEIYNLLTNIFADKKKYEMVLKHIANYRQKNLKEMCHEYDELYSNYRVARNEDAYIDHLKKIIRDNYLFGKTFRSQSDQRIDIINAFKSQFAKDTEGIFNSYSWKLGRAITWLPRKIRKLIKP